MDLDESLLVLSRCASFDYVARLQTQHMELRLPSVFRVIAATIVLISLDMVWFMTSSSLYPRWTNLKPWYGLLAWLSLGLAISSGRPSTISEAATYGAFVGLVAYGVFNGTELAIHAEYRRRWYTSTADLLWGTTANAIASVVLFALANKP